MEYKHLTQKELDAIHDIWNDKYDVEGHIYTMYGMTNNLFLVPLMRGLETLKEMNPDEIMAEAIQIRKEIDEHNAATMGQLKKEAVIRTDIEVMNRIIYYVVYKYLAVIDFDPFKFLELCQVDDAAKEM